MQRITFSTLSSVPTSWPPTSRSPQDLVPCLQWRGVLSLSLPQLSLPPVEGDLHDPSGHDDIVDGAAAVTEAELCWAGTWDTGEVTPAAARHSYLHPHQPRGDQERC